jgi:hypothetical protein
VAARVIRAFSMTPNPSAIACANAMARAYGMLHPGAHTSATVRATFVIDPGGVIRAIVWYPMNVGRSVDETVEDVMAVAKDRGGMALDRLAPFQAPPDAHLGKRHGPAPFSVGRALWRSRRVYLGINRGAAGRSCDAAAALCRRRRRRGEVNIPAASFSVPSSRKSGSQQTHRWRKGDSNSRSHRKKERLFRGLPYGFRARSNRPSGTACVGMTGRHLA